MLLVVTVVAVVVGAATYVTWLASRLDRLHARTDGAWATLDAQLLRRAVAAAALAGLEDLPAGLRGPLADAARRAARDGEGRRETVENDLSRALRAAAPALEGVASVLVEDLAGSAGRVVLARRFYNDAVRDTRNVRRRRLVRWLRLAGRARLPAFFEIDDTPPDGLETGDQPHPF